MFGQFGQTWPHKCRGTHSLTHSLTSEGRSDLHNVRSCADDHRESIVHPWSSSTLVTDSTSWF